MKKLLIMVMASYALTSSAQMRQSEDFLYLFNDSVVYASKITLRPDFSGNLQVRADSRRIPIHQIKFISNKDGYFANTEKMSLFKVTSLAERVIEGKINLFQEVPNDFFMRSRYGEFRTSSTGIGMYYNKGFGDLKRVQYHNLVNDMADNAESMDLLKGYRKKMNTANMLYVSAGASILAAMVSFVTTPKHKPTFGADFGKRTNYTPSYLLLGLGTGIAVGGGLTHLSALREFENAIEVYNR